MTHAALAAEPPEAVTAARYQPGACNIGPAEIARRRRAGHLGVLASIVLLGILVAVDAPPVARLLVALPATMAAAGYLQAWLRFCVAFGSRGVFNFGALGQTEAVADDEAVVRDRRRARQIGVASLVIGVVAGVIATVLPV